MHRNRRVAAATLLALLGPVLVTSIYLLVSRWPERSSTSASDWTATGIAILLGVVGLLLLRVRPWQKAVAILLYVPTMGALLVIFALGFVCEAFGDCL